MIRIFITGMGIISPIGCGVSETADSIKNGKKGLKNLSLFPTPNNPLPVGQINDIFLTDDMPRTHNLALIAAKEALQSEEIPDAIVLGVATGGMFSTEELLKKGNKNPDLYTYHSPGSVAEYIAKEVHCIGPVITISTACSSGTVVMKIALELLRSGKYKKILAGGADSLCRLTYYGFNSLQLIDPAGARPLDINRKGMSVAEGAAMLLLEANEKIPGNAVAEILGAGLSCDAFHPASPHPDGLGALRAMQESIKDAGVAPHNIDYINLHGTGTKDNDLSESKAIDLLFSDNKPFLSSVKGALGHSLAASGAIESVISALCIRDQMIPANIGCETPDPDLKLDPVKVPVRKKLNLVLSNSFGFGGNNASLIIGDPLEYKNPVPYRKNEPLHIIETACFTGAGNINKTIEKISNGEFCKGILPLSEISEKIPPRNKRRLNRLSQLALSLAIDASEKNENSKPSSIFFSTGWGPLTETYDFLTKLYESNEQFTSPTDFIGSVHNAPAGHIAIHLKCSGPNITTTGGDYSFEQSLLTATHLIHDNDDAMLIIGADEFHSELSYLFDKSVISDDSPSDGGGAFYVKKGETSAGLRLQLLFFENSHNNPSIINSLINCLGNPAYFNDKFGALFAGIPYAVRESGNKQLKEFLSLTNFNNPVIDYRKYLGEFASASIVAAALAARFCQYGQIPAKLCNNRTAELNGKSVLILGFGDFISAIEVAL